VVITFLLVLYGNIPEVLYKIQNKTTKIPPKKCGKKLVLKMPQNFRKEFKPLLH